MRSGVSERVFRRSRDVYTRVDVANPLRPRRHRRTASDSRVRISRRRPSSIAPAIHTTARPEVEAQDDRLVAGPGCPRTRGHGSELARHGERGAAGRRGFRLPRPIPRACPLRRRSGNRGPRSTEPPNDKTTPPSLPLLAGQKLRAECAVTIDRPLPDSGGRRVITGAYRSGSP
jgi:hypothetical protein